MRGLVSYGAQNIMYISKARWGILLVNHRYWDSGQIHYMEVNVSSSEKQPDIALGSEVSLPYALK